MLRFFSDLSLFAAVLMIIAFAYLFYVSGEIHWFGFFSALVALIIGMLLHDIDIDTHLPKS